MMKKGQGPAVSIEESQDGFVIELPASLLFKEGSAKIENEDALLFLKRMALIVDTLPNTVDVSVQGHADSAKLGPDSPYKDDWEISVARALSVLHELILDGVDPKRISAAGFGQYRPVASNATKEGRAKNRRVELHFYGTDTDEQSNVQKSILEKSSAK
jgi:chemotaxis protein MotB